MYLAFVDLEKAVYHVLFKALWWSLRYFGIPEWVVGII